MWSLRGDHGFRKERDVNITHIKILCVCMYYIFIDSWCIETIYTNISIQLHFYICICAYTFCTYLLFRWTLNSIEYIFVFFQGFLSNSVYSTLLTKVLNFVKFSWNFNLLHGFETPACALLIRPVMEEVNLVLSPQTPNDGSTIGFEPWHWLVWVLWQWMS